MMKILAKEDFDAFVTALIEDESLHVEGVKAKPQGKKFAFGPLESADELRLDYDVTILPPKKYFLPVHETLMTFNFQQPFSVSQPEPPLRQVIIGVHPYDIVAIKQMDAYYIDTHVDDAYVQRRKNTVIIGVHVVNVSEKAFFGDMGTGTVDSGYDLMLTVLDDSIAIEIGTDTGKALLNTHAPSIRDATPQETAAVTSLVEQAVSAARRDLTILPDKWHHLLDETQESSVWKEQSDKCLGCGTCTMVCPTCFCYDVRDEVDITLETGKRIRTWDGCLLINFTKVGSGEIFREDILERYRHRYNRKGRYLPDMLGFVACVGCGRCSTQCIPDIADPVTVMNSLAQQTESPFQASPVVPLPAPDSPTAEGTEETDELYVPRSATLKKVTPLTATETYFEIELDDGQPLEHQPGQFVEVSIMGYGEAPISISSTPNGSTFELVVRKVGDVTTKLHAMKPGDKVGIRGPFGKGFDTEALKGKDLLFIGGGLGIVPMRSLINYVLDHREDYGDVTILYGCKEPCEILFREEIEQWDAREDINHLLSADTCPEGECWEGEIGVITCLIPKITFDPQSTMAIVVGPPIMYRFVISDLLNRDLPADHIIVSLERRMKCGVGKCGHCQVNGIYICKDGPVFNYQDIKDVPEAFT